MKHFIFDVKNGGEIFVEPIIADKDMKCKEEVQKMLLFIVEIEEMIVFAQKRP